MKIIYPLPFSCTTFFLLPIFILTWYRPKWTIYDFFVATHLRKVSSPPIQSKDFVSYCIRWVVHRAIYVCALRYVAFVRIWTCNSKLYCRTLTWNASILLLLVPDFRGTHKCFSLNQISRRHYRTRAVFFFHFDLGLHKIIVPRTSTIGSPIDLESIHKGDHLFC